jgi:hypothetical protein
MKLLFENWKKYLNEEQQGEGILLYHATCSPPEAFAKGIDQRKAKGYGQGEGFYFWTSLERAKTHAKNYILAGGSKQVPCPDDPPIGYIVVSDEPVTPENFDIDYEVFGQAFSNFIKQNIEYFSANDQALGLGRRAGKGVVGTSIRPNKEILGSQVGRTINLDVKREYDQGEAEIFSLIAQRLSKINPEMFKKFEEEILSTASAVKYNGEKPIYPLRIEDLEGNVVWSRK